MQLDTEALSDTDDSEVTGELAEADTSPGDTEYIPGQETTTAEIPIRIEDGEVQLDREEMGAEADAPEGESLPDLRDGTTGTLRVAASALRDDKEKRRFTSEHLEIIVPRSNLIWLKIGTSILPDTPDFARAFLSENHLPSPRSGWTLIPVALEGHLWLRHRGAKAPVVEGGSCVLPRFLREKAEEEVPTVLETLHQAYSHLSKIFETHRKSHHGDIYKKGFIWNPDTEEWAGLEDIRSRTVMGSIWKVREWLRPWWFSPKRDSFTTLEAYLRKEEESWTWRTESPVLDSPPEEEEQRTQVETAEALAERDYYPSILAPNSDLKGDLDEELSPKPRNWKGWTPLE